MTLARRIIIGALVVLGVTDAALAQQPTVTLQEGPPAVAFVNVNVIPMDRERLEPGQTVVIRNGRITAIGAAGQVTLPDDATLVDGSGRYLVPGLTDAHAHLDTTGGGTRPDFGDAPLYLAHGVTSVINLRGIPEHVVWKHKVESGQLAGPTIYTSGPFIDEPRVNTPEEVQREIRAQASQGYDLIKFHPIGGGPGVATTTGLRGQPYTTMMDAARQANMPLVGHAPVNLGLEAILQTGQPLSHLNELNVVYFLEGRSLLQFGLATGASLLVLLVWMALWGAAAVVRRWRRTVPRRSTASGRMRPLVGWFVLAVLLEIACFVLLWPGGILFDSVILRPVFTGIAIFMAIVSIVLIVLMGRLWRDAATPLLARLEASLVSVVALVLAFVMMVHWVPIAWRSSEAGIDNLGNRLAAAGVSVQTTMVVYDTFIGMNGPAASRILADPTLDLLSADLGGRWRAMGNNWPIPSMATTFLIPRYVAFLQHLTAVLHRHRVPLMAGTDTIGVPLVLPGTSLHRELELLTVSGLTTYETMRTATVTPATFLGRDKEFGTIAIGRRADLLLLEANPLEDIARLKRPLGVMVRGRWLSRDALNQMLAVLAQR